MDVIHNAKKAYNGANPTVGSLEEQKKIEHMESPESVEISCGTLFRVKIAGKEIDRTDMVFDIGQGDWFFSAFLFKTPEGKTA